jgi:hypothetical protein
MSGKKLDKGTRFFADWLPRSFLDALSVFGFLTPRYVIIKLKEDRIMKKLLLTHLGYQRENLIILPLSIDWKFIKTQRILCKYLCR